MVVSKKEKILIFVLILFLLVGGTYTLGIMPKANETKEINTEIESVEADIKAAQAKADASSISKYNQLLKQIEENKTALAALSDPTNDVFSEVQSGNIPGQTDAIEVSKFMNNFFAECGLTLPSAAKVNAPTVANGKMIYRISTSFSCSSMQVLYDFIDSTAKHMSYNIASLTYTPPTTVGGEVSGTLTLTITYLNIENA